MSRFLSAYVGDRAFYKRVLAIGLPVIIQNGVTNLVNLLDNVMVGRTSTEAMSGVSVVNQYMFIFYMMIFGVISAAGIFTAQYQGLCDRDGIRYTFRFKFLVGTVAAVAAGLALYFFGESLVGLFVYDGSLDCDPESTLRFGRQYMLVMLWGLIPYAITQTYASTMRETGDAVTPMIASGAAVLVNLAGNYLLIFGHLGLPAMGVTGAAVATVISRLVEMLILIVRTVVKRSLYPYLEGVYRSPYIPAKLFGSIIVKGLPLMLNELMWALAVTLRNQCYATRGLDAVAAQNISSTITNLFAIVYLSMGTVVSVILGQMLGAGQIEEARKASRWLVGVSLVTSLGMGLVMTALARVFPLAYNTTESVRDLAAYMIFVSAVCLPFCAYANVTYFTVRSGGQVYITILLDSVFMWVVTVPLSLALSRLTDLSILWIYPACQGVELVKGILGGIVVRRGKWARQLVSKTETADTAAQ